MEEQKKNLLSFYVPYTYSKKATIKYMIVAWFLFPGYPDYFFLILVDCFKTLGSAALP